jgi:hypothetical protein
MMNEQADRRALWLLVAGSIVGILLGIIAALRESGSEARVLPDDAIVLVNGRPILEEEYTRAVALFASDKRTEITDADRAHVLNRLIEEELLIQRGIEIGLVDSDRSVRKVISQSMLAAVVAESASEQPSEDSLRAFYAENPSLFTRSVVTDNGRPVAEKTVPKPPAFEAIREQVEAAYLRHSRDDALRGYLEWLRSEAKIVLAPEFLPSPFAREG